MSYVVIGLGNTGVKYANTRHNAGRIIVSELAAHYGTEEAWHKDDALEVWRMPGVIGGEKVTFIIPDGYMNEAGIFCERILRRLDTSREEMVVIYDELDLALGTFKLTYGRGSGGHKGVASIIDALETENFFRVRIGIAPKTLFGAVKKPKGDREVRTFILSSFSRREQRTVMELTDRIADALAIFFSEGRGKAMNVYNTSEKK